jgi:thioester reductase-like protein/FkbH-like protein
MNGTSQAGVLSRDSADGASRLRIRLEWDQIAQSCRVPQVKVAVLATFTANPLTPYLGIAFEQARIPADIWVGPYNQIMSQCLSEDGELAHYRPDILVCWPRLEELWGGGPLPLTDDPASYIDAAAELADACLDAARRLRATLVFVLPALPELRPLGLGDACSAVAVGATAAAVREALRRQLAGQPDVLVFDAEEIVRAVGSARAYNQRMLAVARIPFSEEIFCIAGQRMARLVALGRRATTKTLVVTPDNVLWGGALGELGPKGVDLNEGGSGELYRQVQAFLLELRRAGVRIALCGGYTEPDVWETFARREMRLRQEDLAGWRLGSEPLSVALRALAEELQTDLENVVLITNSADAISEVQVELPDVATILMPDDAAEWLNALQGAGVLDHLPPVKQVEPAADVARSDGADRPRNSKLSLQDFLARLAPEVEVFAAQAHQIEHVAHMTQHTSDFHLTGIQRSSADVEAFLAAGNAECWVAQVRDRLGDYGIAGALLFTIETDTLVVDTFLLNCRVLGRNVEYIVLDKLAEIARERGCAQMRLIHRRTARNTIAGEFVKAVGAEALRQEDDGFSATLPVGVLATLAPNGQQLSSCSIEPPMLATQDRSAAKVAPAMAFLAARWRKLDEEAQARLVALHDAFQSGEQILEAVRAHHRRSRPHLAEEFVAPRTPLEGQLAAIWAQVLGVERVGVRDNFFHLGGHSILATQLVMQLYEVLGVELPVRIFFETPTVESMAQAIDIVRRTGDDTAFTAEAPTYVKAETVLDPTIVADGARPVERATDPSAIFLTGATGFVGAYLLDELLRRTRADIYCLVRAHDRTDGKARIRDNLARYKLWNESLGERVIPVVGDLTRPLLGLSEERFLALANEIDTIYHAGAITSFIYPYSTLKPTNVLGTQEVLRLASRVKLKPVHFISTLYVFAPGDRPEGRAVAEDDIPEHVETMHIGYRQSKWVAEHLVMIARERGIPVSIYRPSRVAGHSATGACQTNDFVWRMIRACIQANSVFDRDMSMDMVPVDYVSRATVHLSLKPESIGQVFHLTNPRVPYLTEIVEWARSYGYPIRHESYEVWRGRLKQAAERSRENASFALVAFLPQDLSRQQLGDLPFDYRNTLAGLADSSIACPPIDEELFHVYLDYFTRSGFLEAPQAPSEDEALFVAA